MFDFPDSQILPLSLEHNFWTWSAQGQVDPLVVTRAKGSAFWDVDGKRYLDFNAMTMCVNIGHGDDRVIEAMIQQLRSLPYAAPGMATRARAALGEALTQVLPEGLSKFLYTLGGADANEHAIRLARLSSGKSKILARYRSYHGSTHGAAALTGDPRRIRVEPEVMPGVVHFLDPYRYRSTFHRNQPDVSDEQFCQDYLNHLEEIIQYEDPRRIAAVLIETVTGTNGVIIPPQGYVQGVRRLCDEYGILMICDEVMSGFGRTGKWFAVNHWNVTPDLMTMAKGLTSGYAPLGAVAMRPEIAAAFDERAYPGGLTYNGHPVSLAAAVAVIGVMQQDDLVNRAAMRGRLMTDLLRDLAEKHPSIGEVRSIGLFGVIELVKNRRTREPMCAFNTTSDVMKAVQRSLLKQGVYVSIHWHTLLLLPPLIISEEELREGFAAIDLALQIADQAVEKDLPEGVVK